MGENQDRYRQVPMPTHPSTSGAVPQPTEFARGFSLPVKAVLGLWQFLDVSRRFQWLSAEEIADYQLDRLKKVVHNAAQRVPFYQRRFQDIGFEPGDLKSLEDLSRLPVLTKRDLREHFWELYDPARTRSAVLSQTSGTTGEPTQFLLTREQTVMELAYHWRFWSWAGYRPMARVAAFRHYTPGLGHPIHRYELTTNTLYFSVHDMDESRLGEYVTAYNQFRPRLVRGYPSSLYILACHALAHGQPLHRPCAVLTSSETLLPAYRQTIEQAFQTNVFDWYGTNERILTACQCEERGEYHLNAEAGLAEYLDTPASTVEGAKSLVLTGLINHVMPLIRYEVGDLAVPGTGPCPCGRDLPTVKQFLGRTDDILVTHEGKRITPVRFYTTFEKFPQVNQFQVVQLRPDHIEARIVVNDRYDRETHKNLAVSLARVTGAVTLEIKRLEQIPATLAGKRRNVIHYAGRSQS